MIILVYLLLFVLPLVVTPFLRSYFEPPKVIIAEVLIQVMVILTIIQRWFKFNQKQLFLTAGLIILSIIQLPFGQKEMFFGNGFRLQGVFLLWHLLLFSLISSSLKLKLGTKLIWVPYLLLFSSIWLFGGNEEGRIIGSLGEPNSLATTFLFLFPLSLRTHPWRMWQPLLLTILSLIIIAVAVYLSGSYSAFIALILELIFLGLIRLKLPLKKTFLTCLILILLSLSLPFLQVSRIYENRAEIWQTAFLAGLSSPILGHGFGNITSSLKEASWKISNNVRFQFVDSSHNIFLDYFVQGGLIGLIILVCLLILSISSLLKNQQKILLTAFLGLLVMFSFNPLSVVNLVAFWWLIGQGITLQNQ